MHNPACIVLLETKCQALEDEYLRPWINFDNMDLVEGQGYAGVIWFFQKNEFGRIGILAKHLLYIHCKLKSLTKEWLITFVYANAHASTRDSLWSELSSLNSNSNAPWTLIGDFKHRSPLLWKKKGVVPFNPFRGRLFGEWINLWILQCNAFFSHGLGGHRMNQNVLWEGLIDFYVTCLGELNFLKLG